MPNPLDANINGQYIDIYSIGKDRSYLVSFLEHGDEGSGDVHVNFRGYPGRTDDPDLRDRIPSGKKTIRGTTPCFADAAGTRTAHGIKRDASIASTRAPTSGTSCSPGATAARSTRSAST